MKMKKQTILTSSVAAGVVAFGGSVGLYFALRDTDDIENTIDTVEPTSPEWFTQFSKEDKSSFDLSEWLRAIVKVLAVLTLVCCFLLLAARIKIANQLNRYKAQGITSYPGNEGSLFGPVGALEEAYLAEAC